jgi:hypothetical protein
MSDKEGRKRRGIRALRGVSPRPESTDTDAEGPTDLPHYHDDAVDGLESAIATLETKLGGNDGIDGLAAWLRNVEETISALRDSDLEHTRDDIRTVIDQLLGVNAEIQDVVRLKKLLS